MFLYYVYLKGVMVLGSNKYKKGIMLIIFFGFLITIGVGCSQTGSGTKLTKKLELAVKYLSESKFEEAILAYNEVIKIDSKNLVAFKGLAKVYILQGNYEEAEKVYQQGITAVDKKEQLYLSLASLYIDKNESEHAKEIYNQLIRDNSRYIPAYEGLARIMLANGQKEQAINILLECVAANKDNERAYSLLGEAYAGIMEKEKALNALSKSMEINLNQQAAYILVERIFNKDWASVISYADQLLAENEKAGRMLKIIGFYNTGQYAGVVSEYEAIAGLGPQAYKATAYVALASLKSSQRSIADKLIAKIDFIKEQNPFVYADVARYYLDVGDIDKARDIALNCIKIDDTCLENYKILYEIAKLSNNEAGQKYYSTLFIVSSVDSTRALAADLKNHQMNTEFIKLKEIGSTLSTDELLSAAKVALLGIYDGTAHHCVFSAYRYELAVNNGEQYLGLWLHEIYNNACCDCEVYLKKKQNKWIYAGWSIDYAGTVDEDPFEKYFKKSKKIDVQQKIYLDFNNKSVYEVGDKGVKTKTNESVN